MRRHLAAFAAVAALTAATTTQAQTADVLYTWDHSFGFGAGPNTEGWGGGGTNAPTLSNATDGVLTITESAPGGDWSASDDFNGYKESAARGDLSGKYFFGGADLTGLSTLEFDLGHNGATEIFGQIFLQPDDGTGCCSFKAQQISVLPGAAQTISVDLAALGLTEGEQAYVRSLGVQIYGHGEGPLTWELGEVRSTGAGLLERVIADHTTGSLENAVVKFDDLGIQSSTGADTQGGLSNLGDGLRWVDLGGTGDPGDESGGAVAWGNGNTLAVSYESRPIDISNYATATVTMRATPEGGANPGASEVDVQFFAQYANRATGNEFDFQDAGILTLPADGEFHELVFPIDGFTDADLTQWIGLNLSPHEGGRLDVRVASVVLNAIPEPTSLLLGLFGLSCVAVGQRR